MVQAQLSLVLNVVILLVIFVPYLLGYKRIDAQFDQLLVQNWVVKPKKSDSLLKNNCLKQSYCEYSPVISQKSIEYLLVMTQKSIEQTTQQNPSFVNIQFFNIQSATPGFSPKPAVLDILWFLMNSGTRNAHIWYRGPKIAF